MVYIPMSRAYDLGFIPNDFSGMERHENDPIHKVCHGNPTGLDMQAARFLHQKKSWVLDYELRTALYSSMFVPAAQSDRWKSWNKDVMRRNLEVLMELQGFLVEASECWHQLQIPMPTTLPNLEMFVVDALELLNILRSPTGAVFRKYSGETHPFHQFHHS